MKYRFIFLLLLCCMAEGPLWGTFHQANEAIREKNIPEAIDLLESISAHSFAKYFNLGCAYLNHNDPVNAWISFERARQIAPYHKALTPAFRKLSLTNDQKNFIPFYQTKFYANIIFAVLLILSGFNAVILLIKRKKGAKFLRPVCALCIALLFSMIFYKISDIESRCVVVEEGGVVRISPTEQGGIIEQVNRGTPLIAREKHGNFIFVKLGKGRNGWIANTSVKYIVE